MVEAHHNNLRRAPVLALLAAFSLLLAGCPPQPGAPVEITLPADADTTLFESTTGVLANGAGQYLFTGRTDQGKRRRALLHFDIAGAIPQGATILEASLHLQLTRTIAGPTTQFLFVVSSDWGEGNSDALSQEGTGTTPEPGDATWLHTFFDTEFWPEPGGGTFLEEDARATLIADDLGPYVFASQGLVEDVQDWLDGALDNFGWIILGDETAITNAKQWRSRESATEAERPALVVKYQP